MNNNQPINSDKQAHLTTGKKFKYSFYSALIFFFVSSPVMYQLTQKLNGHLINVSDPYGCHSNSGLLFHTCIFFIIMIIFFYLIIFTKIFNIFYWWYSRFKKSQIICN